jgi:primosomal protein N' (replication factor Y)
MCPVCDIPLTYHHDSHQLRCHTCGHHETVPASCPVCHATDIVFKSAGTKAIADWLEKHFPSAKIGRFDTDNRLHESLHERHEEVASGELDILVGTQMLVKGLDLPHLSVVGIIAADLSLQIPDFSAEERTYQLLRQAIGRVGRGHTHGTTVIQTFNPENKIIADAIGKNYDDFYTTQIEQRRAFIRAHHDNCNILVFKEVCCERHGSGSKSTYSPQEKLTKVYVFRTRFDFSSAAPWVPICADCCEKHK